MKECRLHGIPLELSGLVYKEFRYEKHVLRDVPRGWPDFNSPPPDEYVLYIAIDVHYRKPHAVLFAFVNQLDQVFLAYEIFYAGTIAQLCTLIREKASHYRCAPIKCDPLADPVTGANMAREFFKNGVIVHPASKAIDHGILAVRHTLLQDGALYVSPNLKRTLFEFNNYVYDDSPNKPEKSIKPKKEADDMMENLYRLLVNKPVWFDESDNNPIHDLEIEPEVVEPFGGVSEEEMWEEFTLDEVY